MRNKFETEDVDELTEDAAFLAKFKKRFKGRCYVCGNIGHKGYECPSRSKNKRTESNRFNKKPICGYCGKSGHTTESCYKRQRDQAHPQHRANKARESEADTTDVVLMSLEKESKINEKNIWRGDTGASFL